VTAGLPPYAAPLAAVDRLHLRPAPEGLELWADKAVTADDPYQAAHFPGSPLYPGVFVLETLRQAVAAAVGPRDGRWPQVRHIRSLRFSAPLAGGDVLSLRARLGLPVADAPFEVTAGCRRADGSPAATLRVRFDWERR
jgi:3-hydroxyacyl-[acyl-carrier-protein] dehydratase